MKFLLVFITTIGISLWSVAIAVQTTRELASTALLDNHRNIDNCCSLLPVEVWNTIMDFLDYQSGKNISQVCKFLFNISKESKSLHRERVRKWMTNGLPFRCHNILQTHLLIRFEESSLEILPQLIKDRKITVSEKKQLLAAINGFDELKIPYQLIVLFNTGEVLPKVKTLSLTGNLSSHRIVKFNSIRSIFSNIYYLNLGLELSTVSGIEFAAKEVFSFLPNLKKLAIRIVKSASEPALTRNILRLLLEILQDKRIILKFDIGLISSQSALPFEIFNSELIEMNRKFSLNERAFFHIVYSRRLNLQTLFENAQEVHSVNFSDYNKDDSLNAIFSKLGKFTRLEKLYLDLNNGIGSGDLVLSEIKPFVILYDLNIRCTAPQCLALLSSLHVVFPNISVLTVNTSYPLDSWLKSFYNLRYLEKITLYTTSSKRGLLNLNSAISNGVFPNLRYIYIPDLSHGDISNISSQDVIFALTQCAIDNPFIRFRNIPTIPEPFY